MGIAAVRVPRACLGAVGRVHEMSSAVLRIWAVPIEWSGWRGSCSKVMSRKLDEARDLASSTAESCT